MSLARKARGGCSSSTTTSTAASCSSASSAWPATKCSRAHDFEEMSDRLVDAPCPECVVLDVNTGGIGGNLKLLDAVRNHPNDEVRNTRVVLIAATASSAMFSWQAGIDEFLPRPFHADALLTAVDEALGRPEEDRRFHRRRMLDASSGRVRPSGSR